jgi:hypothetical protein
VPADGIRVVASKLDFDTSAGNSTLRLHRFQACAEGVCDVAFWHIVTKVENRTTRENLAKVDFWTSLLLRRFSTPLLRSVIDFG